MKKQHDFTKGIKGKFYFPESEIEYPVYLDKENLLFYFRLDQEKNIEMSKLVNQVLSKDRELIQTLKTNA